MCHSRNLRLTDPDEKIRDELPDLSTRLESLELPLQVYSGDVRLQLLIAERFRTTAGFRSPLDLRHTGVIWRSGNRDTRTASADTPFHALDSVMLENIVKSAHRYLLTAI